MGLMEVRSSWHPNAVAQCISIPAPHKGCVALKKGPAGPKPHKLVCCWMGGCNSLNPIRVVWYRKGGEGLQLPEFCGKMGKRPRGCSSLHCGIF